MTKKAQARKSAIVPQPFAPVGCGHEGNRRCLIGERNGFSSLIQAFLVVDFSSGERTHRLPLGAHQAYVAKGTFDDFVVRTATNTKERLLDAQFGDIVDIVMVDLCATLGTV